MIRWPFIAAATIGACVVAVGVTLVRWWRMPWAGGNW